MSRYLQQCGEEVERLNVQIVWRLTHTRINVAAGPMKIARGLQRHVGHRINDNEGEISPS